MGYGLVLPAVLIGLVIFGLLFNAFTAFLEKQGYSDGYTSLLVATGTLVTLAGFAVIVGWQLALIAGLCFAASGAPMIVGSIHRHVTERARDLRSVQAEIQKALGMTK